jgi:hypothetical protein
MGEENGSRLRANAHISKSRYGHPAMAHETFRLFHKPVFIGSERYG